MKDLCSVIFVCILLSLIYGGGDSIKKKKKCSQQFKGTG